LKADEVLRVAVLLMFALALKVPKVWRPKLLKIAFLWPTVIWGPLATEPLRISAWTLYLMKAQSVPTFLSLIIGVYLLSDLRGELRNTRD